MVYININLATYHLKKNRYMDHYRNIINFKEILYKNKAKHVTHKI